VAHKFRQSLAQMEHAFLYEQALDQQRREDLLRTAEVRARQRRRQRERQRSSVRFYLLTLSLVLTAVIVTAVMLGTLYLLLT
jgi:nitrogen fixation/metabolism regulation signal transduction histidine kinase